jgi:hypothetical protein
MRNKVADWDLSPYKRRVTPNALRTIKLRTGQENIGEHMNLVSPAKPLYHLLPLLLSFISSPQLYCSSPQLYCFSPQLYCSSPQLYCSWTTRRRISFQHHILPIKLPILNPLHFDIQVGMERINPLGEVDIYHSVVIGTKILT